MSSDHKESLRELLAKSNELMLELAECNGELTPELEARLAHVDIAVPVKIDGYNHILERLDTEIAYWKEKAKFYQAVAKACESAQEKLKANIKYAMNEAGVEEIHGNDIRFKLSKSKPKLIIQDDHVEDAYRYQVVEYVIDKKKIEDDLKLGVAVAGVELVPTQSIRVYANRKA